MNTEVGQFKEHQDKAEHRTQGTSQSLEQGKTLGR